jgi:hypothetical protein
MGAHHRTMKNMHQHEMQQIFIYLNKQFSRVLFPCENKGVTQYLLKSWELDCECHPDWS